MSSTDSGPEALAHHEWVGEWLAWFAWHPVRLYTTGQYAWLRTVYRRAVQLRGVRTCDYTDMPGEYPSPAAPSE